MSCTYQSKIYVFGGSPGMFSDAVKSVYMFDPQTGNWSQKSDMPYEFGAGGIAVVGDTIYLIGGALNSASPPFSTVMAYDPVTESWTQKADLPTPRNLLSAYALDGKIYAIGGTTEDWGNVFYDKVEVYDPAANTWVQKADVPTGRYGLITFALDGLIYAVGGRAGLSCSNNEVYNPATDTWITKAPMQQLRTGLAGGVINNKIYVAGGHEGPPVVFLSSCEEYTPDLSDVGSGSNPFPKKIELMQNYPNPFNPSTVIGYQLPVSSEVTLKVFDVLGNEIAKLVDEYKPAGSYEVEFSSSSIKHHPSSGVYFYQLLVSALQSKDGKAGDFIQTKKMILLR
jgi:N-acetylneuraminic acid mutarotase